MNKIKQRITKVFRRKFEENGWENCGKRLPFRTFLVSNDPFFAQKRFISSGQLIIKQKSEKIKKFNKIFKKLEKK